MEIELIKKFFSDFEKLNQTKSDLMRIVKALRRLQAVDGFINGVCEMLTDYSPLKEFKYKKFRIFYYIKDSKIIIIGILKKDCQKFNSKILKKMKNRIN